MDTLHVDCDNCIARGPACGDCVITVLLGAMPLGVDLNSEERAALAALADSGLVPPLRLIPLTSIPGAIEGQSVQSPLEWQDYA
jgi:hypothetical protein